MKHITYLLTVISFCCLVPEASSQYYSYKQLTKAGDAAYEEGKFLQALNLYERAIAQNDDSKGDIIYKAGKSAMEVNSFNMANEYFQKYLTLGGEENEAEVLYEVARLEHLGGSYEKAIISYDLYLSEYADRDMSLTKNVQFYRDAAEWAVSPEVDEAIESVQRLDDEINSPKSENGPVLFNNQLYYSSNRFPIEGDDHDRMKSELLRGKDLFQIPGIKANQLVSNPAFNKAGTKIYFSLCDYEGLYDVKCDLYSADLDATKSPSNLTRLPDHINVPGTSSTQPTLQETSGVNNLIFSSDRPGGQGGNDIYRAEIKDDGSLSSATNYQAINTAGDDLTPFYHNTTETLYYSTNGRKGFGGYDIFKLTTADPLPQNLGSNINTSYNELYYSLAADQVQAHFTSNRPGSLYSEDKYETCCYDIYSAKPAKCIVNLEALTFDAKTRTPLSGTQIKIVDKSTGDVVYNQALSGSDATLELPCSDKYELTVSKDGYDDLTISLTDLMTADRNDEGQVSKSLYLVPNIIGLELSVFEEVMEAELNGATVYLTDLTTNEQKVQQSNPGNIFNFELKPNRDYLIEINKDGFKEEELRFNSGEEKVTKRAILKYLDIVEKSIVSLENAIPVSLYFDNDSPARGATNENSDKTYTQTYDAYYGQKSKFMNSYLALFSGSDKLTANDEMEYLFESNIRSGFEKYDVFKKQLQIVLEAGQDVNIYLRGYASPLAQSDYNTALGKRRVDSIRKEFNEWNNGVFIQYLNSGLLKVTERSFGETTVPQGVSDDPNAPSKSIYSPGASKERRVEIDEIKIIR